MLVKKLLTADLSKRYGNLKNGSDDIVKHKWFVSTLDFETLCKYEHEAPFRPPMKDDNDWSNYEDIPDSGDLPPPITGANDPFANW